MDVQTVKLIAWVATLFCVWIPVKCATTFYKKSILIFLSLVMISLGWSLLLPYYGSVIESEFLPAFSGFLFVCAGRILHIEAIRRVNSENNAPIGDLPVYEKEHWSLWLFLFLISPSAISLAVGYGTNISVSMGSIEVVIGGLMSMLGYLMLYDGVKKLHKSGSQFKVLHYIVWPYLILEGIFIYRFYTNTEQCPKGNYWKLEACGPMSESLYVLFAAAKILLTVAVIILMMNQTLPDEQRKLPWYVKLRMIVVW